MKILITGGNGQLGTALKEVLTNEKTLFTDTDNMDIADKDQIEKTFSEFKPEYLIHGAAYTNVDGCEQNPDIAEKINAQGTTYLAEACKKYKCEMLCVSTDYVFDGKNDKPYLESDLTNPQSVYGKTKLEGEIATREIVNGYVVRTSWVYGEGKNFVKTMLMLSEKMSEIKVVNDQLGRPTNADDLAGALYTIIKIKPEKGVYNFTNDGEIISWADFATEIFKIAGKKTKVTKVTTEEYLAMNSGKTIAPRPAYSALDLDKTKNVKIVIRNWREALTKYLT
jgi:dTDP-4-dehydrorhamnose reductase